MLRYREIKLEIKKMIAGMNNGERLQSRNILSKKLDSSRATVDKAIKELVDEGILESRFGSGTYVARRLEGVVNSVRNWCVIVPNISESIYNSLVSSVKNVAQKMNINVILCDSENSADKQSEFIKRLIMAGVDGFIIVPVITNNVMDEVDLYKSLIESRIPYVFCNRDVEGVLAPVVRSNDFLGGYLATVHLLEQGYQNIAYLACRRYRISIERCQGYISALQHYDQKIVRRRILILDENTPECCRDSLQNLLKSDSSVDAVFCFDETVAFEAVKAIESMKLRISDDIGIIGYNNSEQIEKMSIPLTTVSYRIDEVGEMAAHVLNKKMDNTLNDKFEYYLLAPRVVVRSSCLGKKTNKQ